MHLIMNITAPLNNLWTSKIQNKTNAFYATINQMFSGSSQLLTTGKRTVIKSPSTVWTTEQCSAVVGSWKEPPNI